MAICRVRLVKLEKMKQKEDEGLEIIEEERREALEAWKDQQSKNQKYQKAEKLRIKLLGQQSNEQETISRSNIPTLQLFAKAICLVPHRQQRKQPCQR
jgi:hypothetical protein